MPSPTSPATQGSDVSVSATIDFNNTPVTINSQDIISKQGGLRFSITNPVTMGSFDDLVDWMNKQLHLPVTSQDVDTAIGNLPEPFKTPLEGIVHAIVQLTVLNINTTTNQYEVAATITADPDHPIDILGILSIQQIGIQIGSGGTGSPSSPA